MTLNNRQTKLIQDIQDEIKCLCETGVWTIKWTDIECWLSNFRENDEHYFFAHLLLDKIIFRSNKAIETSYKRFLATTVRYRVNRISNKNFNVPEFFSLLRRPDSTLLSHFRVSSISTGEQGESGSSILRHLNSELINPKYNLQKENKPNLSNDYIILVIDDFLGSGEQACKFFKGAGKHLNYLDNHNNLLFSPALAMSSGVENFEKIFPELEIHPLELIMPEDCVFYGDHRAPFGRDNSYTIGQAIKCYKDIKRKYEIGLRDWFGRGDAGLPIIFQLGVPNQSLGIIFHQSKGWHTLQTRRSS